MKKLVSEYAFSAEQLNKIADLARETGFTEQIVRILYARGVDTADKIDRFMNPSRRNFLSPFLMKGMKETVEMLTQARDEGKTVAVFGDYDADGVCASTIMYYALKEFGMFENGGADLFYVEKIGNLPCHALDVLPFVRFGG